jgi:hypothetical protein
MDLDVPFRYEDSDSNGDSEWSTGWEGKSGGSDGDDEESIGSDGEDSMMPVRSQFHTFVCSELKEMYVNRYKAPRNQHPRGSSLMQFTLNKYKALRVDLFHQDLRVIIEIICWADSPKYTVY